MKRLALLGIVATALALALVAAAFVANSPARVPLATSPSDADHVTLYENGLAAITLHRHFNATEDGNVTLTLPLPPSANFDSLTIEGDGVTLVSMRSALAQTSGIHAGDNVTVHVDQQSYHGTVQAIEPDQIAVATGSGIVFVKLDKVSAIEVEQPAAPAAPSSTPGSLDTSIVVRTTAGDHDVTVTYLANGPGWTPSYRLDESTGALTYFASLTGLDDWHGITLDLVSGAPHVVYTPSPMPFAAAAASAGAASVAMDASVSFSPSTAMGELHRYHYDGALDVARGEAVRLVLAQGHVAVLRHYLGVEATLGCCGTVGDPQDVPVLEKLHLRNDLQEPLAPGTVGVYLDGAWVGEDQLASSVAPGDEANVTVSRSDEVHARLVLASHDATSSSDEDRYQLTVRDLKATSVDLRVVMRAPSYRTTLGAYSPQDGAVEGTTVTWERATLAAGGTGSWSLAYETLKY